MRIISKGRDHFLGTHKGYTIDIEKEPDGSFYIRVYNPEISFGTAYDGWAPEHIRTMKDAKREALRGSGLLKTAAESAAAREVS